MANRPKLGQIQKDYSDLKSDMRNLNNDLKGFKNEVRSKFKEIDRRDVIRLLQEQNSIYSDKYRYTYEEIGSMVGISTTEVANISKEEGLARRGKSQGA
jgi:beta-N-acetylglucosaminidase